MVSHGDRVRVTLIGGQYQEFIVTKLVPAPSLVSPETKVVLISKGKPVDTKNGKDGITYEDIGGLKGELQKIREMIELPLKHPELFERVGIEPPKGVLLFGPPGCGKTLVAKALAHETEVNFISIKGPALMSKWVGETEKQIREVFRKARQHAPCIIFFDEVEAIAPRRGKDVSGVSDRALSQLLTEIDGMESLGGVVILAATNRVDLVDEAFLRPGRFDFHFVLGLPNEKSRLEIFKIHTKEKPLAEDVDLAVLAQRYEFYYS